MGANMTYEEKVELSLNFNVCILVAVEIVASALFFKLTKMLNAIDRAPIQTIDEASRQRNTFVLFKTNALLTKQQARNKLEVPLRQRRGQKYSYARHIQLVEPILRNKKLSEQQISLYLLLDWRLSQEAYFNKFAVFRALLYKSNIPKLYPSLNNSSAFQNSSSVFYSQNMLAFAKINGKEEMTQQYMGFNRQFIIKLFSRQRQICLIEFFAALWLLLLHKQQIVKIYNHLSKLLKKLFTKKSKLGEIRQEETCIICYAAPRNLVLRECKHFILCSDCVNNDLGCPYCGKKIKGNRIKVRFE